MSVGKLVMTILLMAASVVMIVSVLLQKGDADALSALGGGGSGESFFGKNKAKTLQGRLALLTKVSAVAFITIALLMIFIA